MVASLAHNPPLEAGQHATLYFQLISRSVPKSSSHVRYHYGKADYDGMREFLKQSNWDDMIYKTTVDECWESFEKRLLKAREVFVMQHKIEPSNAKKKPMCMTADARTNINIKKQQFRKYRKTRSILD